MIFIFGYCEAVNRTAKLEKKTAVASVFLENSFMQTTASELEEWK